MSINRGRNLLTYLAWLGMLILLGSLTGSSAALAQESPPYIRDVRIFDPNFTLPNAAGLAFSPQTNAFLLLADHSTVQPAAAPANLLMISPFEDFVGSANLPTIASPINMAYDSQANRLLLLDTVTNELIVFKVGPTGPDPTTITRFPAGLLGLQNPQGMTLDPASGHLFILDSATSQIVRVEPDAQGSFDPATALAEGRISRVDLSQLGLGTLRGLAFNPTDGHLYFLNPAQLKLYEVTQAGQLVASRDLSDLDLTFRDPQGIVFAPSVDSTDDPAQMHLYLADSGLGPVLTSPSGKYQIYLPLIIKQGQGTVAPDQSPAPGAATEGNPAEQGPGRLIEFSLTPPSLLAPAALPSGTTLLPTTLVHIIDTSIAAWSPSAPDTAGIDYWPLTGRLLISDSEVDEMPNYFMGKNVFQSTTSGTLVSTCSTMAFTPEPTGVAINPNNNHIFFTTDDKDRVFEVSLGLDGVYCTADDTVTITNVTSLYGINDAEDAAYGNNTLFIAGGADAEVYIVPLGANGVLGGGDDGPMTHFDTASLGFADLEGIGYKGDSGTLFIVSAHSTDKYLGETTTTGALLRAYDLAAYTGLKHREDVTFAPGSQNPAIKTVYITARGVDNNSDPNENDGKVWEINIGSGTPTPPVANFSGTPTTGPAPLSVSFTDQSTNNPTAWSWNFGDGGTSTQQNPSHSYNTAGTYTVSLTATNASGSDSEVKTNYITVTAPSPPVANFIGSPTTGPAPLSVSFTDQSTNNPTTWSWTFGDGGTSTQRHPSHSYNTAGIYTVTLTASNASGADDEIKIDYITVNPASPANFRLSLSGSSTVSGISAKDEDILNFDGTNFAMLFDGSDVGVGGVDLDAFYVVDADTILMSFDNPVTIGALGTVADTDIVQFDATSLGAITAGSFSMYFNGSDVGLDTSSEDIDAIELLSDGRLLISTSGSPSIPGVTGGADEDLLAFTPTSLGSVTSGTWAMYFEGSDVELSTTSDEDVDGVSVAANGHIYLTTRGNFAVTGVSGADEDVFICTPSSLGTITACTYSPTLFFDGSLWGLDANDLDAIDLP